MQVIDQVSKRSLCAAVLALLVCASGWAGQSRQPEKTPGELTQIAKSPSRSPLERVDALNKLAALTDANLIRDYRVVEDLILIAKPKDSKVRGDIFVRQTAIEALGKIQKIETRAKDKYLPAFAPILKDKTEHMIVARAVALNFKDTLDNTGLPDRDAYTVILAMAKDKTTNMGVRMVCIDTLGTYGSTDGLDVLVALLGEQEQLVREHAAGAIYELFSHIESGATLPLPAVNKLVEMVGDKAFAADLKVNVMKVLGTLIRDGNMGAKAAMPAIIQIVQNEQDEKLVKGGIIALGLIGTAEAVEPLARAYNDFFVAAPSTKPADPAKPDAPAVPVPVAGSKESGIRLAIMEAFISVMSNQVQKPQPDMKAVGESVVVLTKAAAEDADTGVRKGGIFALRYLYAPSTKSVWKTPVHTLGGLLLKEGTSEDIKREIINTLQAITGQDYGNDYKRWDDWIQKNIK